MSNDYLTRAQILIEALPYIQKYNGKIVVIKYGGNAMISEELRTAVMSDIILLSLVGVHVVVVHGGGPEISSMLKKVGKESQFVDGLRYTDEETMDVVQDVLCGKVNKNLVAALNRMGGKAMGLCGLDGALFEAKVKNPKYGLVGEITKVNPGIIYNCLENGYIPVVSTVGYGVDAECSYNINADTAAAKIAGMLKAESFINMTDTAGLLEDENDESTLIGKIFVSEAQRMINQGLLSGGMIPKVSCCIEAIRRGVKKVFIIDGRVPHSILIETLTDEGMGTMFVSGENI